MNDNKRRAIGKLVSVAADKFVVEMHAGTDNFTVVGFDDIHYVARLGSFVVVPVQSEFVVAEVVGLREKDASQRSGSGADLEKASSAKFLDVVPLGMLPQDENGDFRFGVTVFPALYTDALYVLDQELDRIFETSQPSEVIPNKEPNTAYKALAIGSSVIFDGYDVKVLVDEFFGGHSAILGNTGSGKSCTVASVLQSLFEKPDEYKARGATFIVFDVNGEYETAFADLNLHGIDVKTLKLDGTSSPGRFQLPHWFLDHSEWELLLQASEKTQIPVLRTALGLTAVITSSGPEFVRIRKHILATCILGAYQGGDGAVAKRQRIVSLLDQYGIENLTRAITIKHGYNEQYANFGSTEREKAFFDEVKASVDPSIEIPAYAGSPFAFSKLSECLDLALLYEEAHGNRQIRDYCSQMLTRFKALSNRPDYAFLRQPYQVGQNSISEGEFLRDLLGVEFQAGGLVKRSQIVILDMNELEDEVVELVSAVMARMIFKLLRKAEPRNQFPVHCILEEAHRYVAEKPAKFSIDAARVFERIAKEGRKYGLFIMLASQRPSEVSKTVLSQCSNFVVHRIQNPDDLSQIRQMTPFISDEVLKRLPSLPKQHALVFGNSVKIPTTFKVRTASPKPHSDDSKVQRLWFQPAGQILPIKIG
ncbi:ATP-binding protein [Stenotrophobium rhamnosiphilum]|uniref:ATPase n=1 Tax=Stenotrophobium rhamnosiphilum TaxID=2029166 RepID=A0A2T5MB23_9GAMM|nr:ATP-binding protein [Stenotrophobium rhamnosiphilum]PTU27729.1 ATPase [Stenotrophobium rhamnosiphilum]